MERLWCYLAGFAVALVLMIMYIVAKNEAEKYKEKVEHRVKQLAEVVFYEELQNVVAGYHPCSLKDFVDKRIDQRLAEKEGENESDRC